MVIYLFAYRNVKLKGYKVRIVYHGYRTTKTEQRLFQCVGYEGRQFINITALLIHK